MFHVVGWVKHNLRSNPLVCKKKTFAVYSWLPDVLVPQEQALFVGIVGQVNLFPQGERVRY